MATHGDFARVWFNGLEITGDSTALSYVHQFTGNPVLAQNVGVKQTAPGIFNPTLNYAGYVKHGNGVIGAYNAFAPSGIGSNNDFTWNVLVACGQNASPAVGDACMALYGTRGPVKRDDTVQDLLGIDVSFKSRGLSMPPFPTVQYFNDAFKTATNLSSTPYDDGAECASGTVQGAVAMLQVYTPTGVAATGNISLSGTPADGDTFTINGTPYTFKTALAGVAGQVLIGGSASAAILNLYYALIGDQPNLGTAYVSGTTSFSQNINNATVYIAPPTSANVINFTFATTGTGGNAFTLAKTGANSAVSAATLSGGTAGDTYNVVFASATSSGGSYTTFATFNGVGATRAAYRAEVAPGTTINEWIKVTITLASGTGTTQTMGVVAAFGRFFQA